MGLDQYAFAVLPHPKNTPTSMFWSSEESNPPPGIEPKTEIAYWRKHPNLQGWMERLYEQKGGEEEFNCAFVELTPTDLDSLEAAVKREDGEALPLTEGFFFGHSSDDSYRQDDLAFIEKARQAIAQDMQVYYYSWW